MDLSTVLILLAFQAVAIPVVRRDRAQLIASLIVFWLWPVLAAAALAGAIGKRFGLLVKWRGALTDRDLQADRPGILWERRLLGLFHTGHWYRVYKGPVVGRWWGIGLHRQFGVTLVRTADL